MAENSYHAIASMSLTWFLRLTIWGARVPLVLSWYDAALTPFLVAWCCLSFWRLSTGLNVSLRCWSNWCKVCLSLWCPWILGTFVVQISHGKSGSSVVVAGCFNDSRPGSSPPRPLLWWRRESISDASAWNENEIKRTWHHYIMIMHAKPISFSFGASSTTYSIFAIDTGYTQLGLITLSAQAFRVRCVKSSWSPVRDAGWLTGGSRVLGTG